MKGLSREFITTKNTGESSKVLISIATLLDNS
jgi:hypothetical protein